MSFFKIVALILFFAALLKYLNCRHTFINLIAFFFFIQKKMIISMFCFQAYLMSFHFYTENNIKIKKYTSFIRDIIFCLLIR